MHSVDILAEIIRGLTRGLAYNVSGALPPGVAFLLLVVLAIVGIAMKSGR